MEQIEVLRPLTHLLTPFYRQLAGTRTSRGSNASTPILDFDSAEIQNLIARVRAEVGGDDLRQLLQAAHTIIKNEVAAVYSLNERQPTSATLRKGVGSCSQRLAILEAVARGLGIFTRVNTLVVDRSFWRARFPHIYQLLPDQMLLVWPQFQLDGQWSSASELFGSIGCKAGAGFANSGSETLFEAAGRCAVDWDGSSKQEAYDLSAYVVKNLGTYPSRDEVFSLFGETLNPLAKLLLNPVLSRVRA